MTCVFKSENFDLNNNKTLIQYWKNQTNKDYYAIILLSEKHLWWKDNSGFQSVSIKHDSVEYWT